MNTDQVMLFAIVLLMAFVFIVRMSRNPNQRENHRRYLPYEDYPEQPTMYHAGMPHAAENDWFEKLIATLAAISFVWFLVTHVA